MANIILPGLAASLLFTSVIALDVLTHYSVVFILRKRDVGALAY